jgi:hypothetical protein
MAWPTHFANISGRKCAASFFFAGYAWRGPLGVQFFERPNFDLKASSAKADGSENSAIIPSNSPPSAALGSQQIR